MLADDDLVFWDALCETLTPAQLAPFLEKHPPSGVARWRWWLESDDAATMLRWAAKHLLCRETAAEAGVAAARAAAKAALGSGKAGDAARKAELAFTAVGELSDHAAPELAPMVRARISWDVWRHELANPHHVNPHHANPSHPV